MISNRTSLSQADKPSTSKRLVQWASPKPTLPLSLRDPYSVVSPTPPASRFPTGDIRVSIRAVTSWPALSRKIPKALLPIPEGTAMDPARMMMVRITAGLRIRFFKSSRTSPKLLCRLENWEIALISKLWLLTGMARELLLGSMFEWSNNV